MASDRFSAKGAVSQRPQEEPMHDVISNSRTPRPTEQADLIQEYLTNRNAAEFTQ